jgi:hypothetical protein
MVSHDRSSAVRVETLLTYIDQNKDVFGGQRGNVVFSGGWAGAGQDLERPLEHFREGALMLDQYIGKCAPRKRGRLFS